ncbi:MAG TPA: hypothetical protein VHJ76_04315 [Actinomycetota bacterium]|nr:hypothetical protein [Actinomycetota bacterium]
MHPVLLGEIAEDHVRSLIHEADAARLARSSTTRRPDLRRRLGLRLIAAGERLAPDSTRPLPAIHPTRPGRA